MTEPTEIDKLHARIAELEEENKILTDEMAKYKSELEWIKRRDAGWL